MFPKLPPVVAWHRHRDEVGNSDWMDAMDDSILPLLVEYGSVKEAEVVLFFKQASQFFITQTLD